jgi:hypothetical protein
VNQPRQLMIVESQRRNFADTTIRAYVPRFETYMGPETPNPVLVGVQRGRCELEAVLKDILGQTKINFNTCLNNDCLPATIRFAYEVGDVLIAAPIESEPRLPFKFYI